MPGWHAMTLGDGGLTMFWSLQNHGSALWIRMSCLPHIFLLNYLIIETGGYTPVSQTIKPQPRLFYLNYVITIQLILAEKNFEYQIGPHLTQ